ncbi:MAG TPA: dienelactone hydrolase family protein [Methylomirabilota bacterium]|jgi:carboxymethylenebutenolidase|nr:dienelactone hydrolase family protein [Methylomirabilota bacterium]
MCFDPEARPPITPIAGGATEPRDVVLTSADGTRFGAYAARAARPTGAGMLVLPDVRGLHQYYQELTLRFAENGIDAVAIDYFARSAGLGDRGEEFEFLAHVPQTTPETLQADIAAAATFLRGKQGGAVRALFAVGFCFGGALSFLQAASGLGYAGVIGFYGWPLGLARWPDRPRPIDAVPRFACSVLALYGGADPGIPASAVAEFDQALTRAGVSHESVTYDGAPHSFFDRRQTEFADASADAWRRVRAFVAEQS